MSRLAAFYDIFLDAVIELRPTALGAHLDDPAAADNAIVYRNNVFRGGADALANAYPTVARMAGEAYFESVATAYVERLPPRVRSLALYGADFPEFLETAPGVEQAPYLPDAARLDRAWLEAHWAPDADTLAASALASLAPERLASLQLRLHPSVRITPLQWTVHEAWSANRSADGGERRVREVRPGPQTVLFWRPDYEVAHRLLDEGEGAFFEALRDDRSLGEAAEAAMSARASFNTSLTFAAMLDAGLFDAAQPGIDEAREERK